MWARYGTWLTVVAMLVLAGGFALAERGARLPWIITALILASAGIVAGIVNLVARRRGR